MPDGKLAPARRTANRLGRRAVVYAERLLLVRTHIGVDPRHLVGQIALDHRQTSFGAGLIDGNFKSVRKLSLNYVARHRVASIVCLTGSYVHTVGPRALRHIGRTTHIARRRPLSWIARTQGPSIDGYFANPAMDLLERQFQLDELTRHLREAGAGKSALVEEFARQAARTARVLWGHSDALQTSRVLGPVNEVIAGLSLLPDTARESGVSQLAMTSDHVDEALEFGQRALDLAIRFEDHSVRAHALNNIGTALSESGIVAGFEKLAESLTVALEHNLQAGAGRAYANIVSTSARQRLSALALRYLPEGIDYCEVHDVQDSLSYIRVYGAQLEFNSGQWDKAARVAAELIEHHVLATAQRLPALAVLARVRARRGDPGVDQLLDEALRLALPTGELQRIGPIAAARAEVAWYRGDLGRVAEEAAIGLRVAAGSRDSWIPGELAYWGHCANPELHVSGNVAETYSLMIEGDWERAAAAWQQLGAPYERALALAGGPEEALRESLDMLEQMGAGPLSAIVRQRLRGLGVRGIPRGPRTSTRENPAGLTSREVQVLTLLVRGHTNSELAHRLHISAKTIDHHVSSILEKLDVRSRTEAAAAAFGL